MAQTGFKVDGLAYYASILRPNKATESFGLELVVDEETSATLQALGLKPARKQDGTAVSHGGNEGDVFRIKRKTHKADGTPLGVVPQLVDSSGNEVDTIVGNGSKVRVYGNAYEYTFKGKSGVSASLNAVQIIDLVKYERFDNIDGGFVSNSAAAEPKDIEGGDVI